VPPTPDQQQPPREDPGNITAIVGLIVGFVFFPLIGLIVCIVANNQSKQAGFKNTVAVVGMWIHGVLTALMVLAFILLIVLLALSSSTAAR
jgi:heme/copper-type cytochrome/quinol oxidase subunit 2